MRVPLASALGLRSAGAVVASFGCAFFVRVSEAAADPLRLVVAVGSRDGLPAERPLRYADTDAARVRDVLVQQGGVREGDAMLLRAPTRAELVTTLARVRARARTQPEGDVTLVFYFSGHGDRDALHLPGERFTLAELETELTAIPAGLRIVVTDACRSTRDKGFAAEDPFAIALRTPTQASGTVWLNASSDGEAAQESDELGGALFTHAWLSGLRGAADANADARVTLDESFAFAQTQTLIRSAKTSGVLQRPEAILRLRELAPVVLTEATPKLAALTLPKGRDTHFLVYSANEKSIVAELWGVPDRATSVRAPAGRYVVVRRSGGGRDLAHVTLGTGELRALGERDFTTLPADVLAQKGFQGDATLAAAVGGPQAASEGAQRADASQAPLSPAARSAPTGELSVGYDLLASSRLDGIQGPRVTYAYPLGTRGAFYAGASFETGERVAPAGNERVYGGLGRVGLEYRLPLGPVTMRGGGGGRAGALVQTLTRLDAETVAADGYAPASTQTAFAGGPELFVGARVGATPKSRGWFGELTLTGNALFVRERDSVGTWVSGGVAAGGGLSF